MYRLKPRISYQTLEKGKQGTRNKISGSVFPLAAPKQPETARDPPGGLLGPSDHKIEIQTDQGQFPQTFWVDFGPQNGIQNHPKTSEKPDEKCITFYPSWTRLGAVLRRSWASLGVKQGLGIKQVVFALVLLMFREHRLFWKKTTSRRILGPTWPDLAPKRGSRRTQNGPKTSSTLIPKSKPKNNRRMDLPELHEWYWQSHLGPWAPTGGVCGEFNIRIKSTLLKI